MNETMENPRVMKPGQQTEIEFEGLFDDMDPSRNQAFYDYHKQYPEVYQHFKRLALGALASGETKWSARGLFWVMRWKQRGKRKEDGYMLNNNYSPYYARLFERDYPQHEGFFEKRMVKKTL